MIGQPARDLASYGHLLVRRAILRDDWVADAIFDLAANGKEAWTTAEWTKLESELAGSDLLLRDWLILYD